MYYTGFRIKNFKGIKDTTIKLRDQSKMNVFSFVGLNESGKTTILEAIHSFSPDSATNKLVGTEKKEGILVKNLVPRHLISNFSDDITVSANIKFEKGEKETFIKKVKESHDITINSETLPDEINLERIQRFKNGDYEKTLFNLITKIELKSGKQKKWRSPTAEEDETLKSLFKEMSPNIAYFPTFVFDFPKRIFLTEGRDSSICRFYRAVFQDILDYDGKGLTIEKNIARRVRSPEKTMPWLQFLNDWQQSDDRKKIQHVIDRASSVVTDVVFGRWNDIFGEEIKGKEIQIISEVAEGERSEANGVKTKTKNHDIFIEFKIKDGTRRFDVNDRSLGFRWFFAFMLFTQFRVARQDAPPILFLFDEPANNLHAAAQQKLIESFPEIAKGHHTLAYTTHSHYMIEPKWLEQTFIVTNRADEPSG
ncbi:MAG: AAA family ATPase, partial [Bdellovibrionota bacterium]